MLYLTSNTQFFAAVAGLLGLLVGSFLNVVIHRLPRMIFDSWETEARETLDIHVTEEPSTFNLAWPGSHCPSCQQQIRAWQNIPVLSWLILGGRCASCRARISPRYPMVELGTALISYFLALHFGFSAQALFGLILCWGLIPLAFIDIDEMLLPDSIVVPGIWIGLIAGLYGAFAGLVDAVIGAVAGYLVLAIPGWIYGLIKGRPGMGGGDLKLMALLGAWLGWQALPLVLIISALLAVILGLVVIRRRETPFPYGPFLIIGGMVAMFFGQQIYGLYGAVFGLDLIGLFYS